jgi:hypothetical protein
MSVDRLAVLEEGHREAEQALVDLRAAWAREDEATRTHRRWLLEAHSQGARDRDAMRVKLGGASVIEAEAQTTREAAARRLAAADAEAKRVAPAPPGRVAEAVTPAQGAFTPTKEADGPGVHTSGTDAPAADHKPGEPVNPDPPRMSSLPPKDWSDPEPKSEPA